MLLAIQLVEAAGGEVLRYSVRADPFEVELSLPDGTRQTRRLKRQATHFYLESGWPVPQGPDGQPVRCEIRWNGFPSTWRLVNSFGVDRRVQTFQTTLGELRKAVFAGGDFRITPSKQGLWLVTRATRSFSDSALLELLDRISVTQTGVWRDPGLRGHLVYLLAADGSGQGDARTRAMVVEASPAAASLASLAQLFAHELFHEWNAHRLNGPEDERLYWFTEGVTDYHAALTLWRQGIWTFERFADSFNTAAPQYFGSPARNLTAERMLGQRQSDANAERLPYLQGYLLASHWNRDGRVFDRGMRNLKKSNREPLSNRRIADALAAAGIGNVDAEIDRFVNRGETIVVRPRIFGDCAAESKIEVRQFDIGFDLQESRKNKTIHGVRPTSTAGRAGVRDGQLNLKSATSRGRGASNIIRPRLPPSRLRNTRPIPKNVA